MSPTISRTENIVPQVPRIWKTCQAFAITSSDILQKFKRHILQCEKGTHRLPHQPPRGKCVQSTQRNEDTIICAQEDEWQILLAPEQLTAHKIIWDKTSLNMASLKKKLFDKVDKKLALLIQRRDNVSIPTTTQVISTSYTPPPTYRGRERGRGRGRRGSRGRGNNRGRGNSRRRGGERGRGNYNPGRSMSGDQDFPPQANTQTRPYCRALQSSAKTDHHSFFKKRGRKTKEDLTGSS